MRAASANVAFWLRQGANALDNDGRHFTDSDSDAYDPGDVCWNVLGFQTGIEQMPGGGFVRHEEREIDACFAVTWGLEIGATIGAMVQRDPFGDHTAAVASIVAHYREVLAEQLKRQIKYESDRLARERERQIGQLQPVN